MKAYFWESDKDSETGIPVIADNIKEAKRIGASWWGFHIGHEDYDWFINQRCRLLKDADITGLEKGAYDDEMDGLKRGLFGWVGYMTCPTCGAKEVKLYHDKNMGFYCDYCDEQEMENETRD
jgi:hypothetical protein